MKKRNKWTEDKTDFTRKYSVQGLRNWELAEVFNKVFEEEASEGAIYMAKHKNNIKVNKEAERVRYKFIKRPVEVKPAVKLSDYKKGREVDVNSDGDDLVL